jgi:chromosome segregation ATPase
MDSILEKLIQQAQAELKELQVKFDSTKRQLEAIEHSSPKVVTLIDVDTRQKAIQQLKKEIAKLEIDIRHAKVGLESLESQQQLPLFPQNQLY